MPRAGYPGEEIEHTLSFLREPDTWTTPLLPETSPATGTSASFGVRLESKLD